MNYISIHDSIICRAKTRFLPETIYYENHHIIPKCEGGEVTRETVKLTFKEHRLIHLLRYKITKNKGNLIAYNLMKGINLCRQKNAILSAKEYHIKWKKFHTDRYIKNQTNAGILGGISSKNNKKGWFGMSEEDKILARNKGRKKTIELKLGMFSRDFIDKKKLGMMKRISTPDREFDSMDEAAKFYSVSNGTITYRINSKSNKFAEWKFI